MKEMPLFPAALEGSIIGTPEKLKLILDKS